MLRHAPKSSGDAITVFPAACSIIILPFGFFVNNFYARVLPQGAEPDGGYRARCRKFYPEILNSPLDKGGAKVYNQNRKWDKFPIKYTCTSY